MAAFWGRLVSWPLPAATSPRPRSRGDHALIIASHRRIMKREREAATCNVGRFDAPSSVLTMQLCCCACQWSECWRVSSVRRPTSPAGAPAAVRR
eukprot:scaffold2725_cov119-Isochrysis_galbana.AAC.6